MTSRREQFRAIFLATVMVVSMVAMGTTALAGSAAADNDIESNSDADIADEITVEFNTEDGNTNLTAGSGEQELPRLAIQDEIGDILNDPTDITLPDGVSFNVDRIQEAGGPTFAGDLEVEEFSFENDNQTLVLEDHESPDEADDRILIRDLFVDVDADIDSSFSGESESINVDTGGGDDDYDVLNIFNNQISDGTSSVPADGDAGIEDPIIIETSDDATTNMDGFELNAPINETTDLIIATDEEDGLGFSDDFDASDLTLTTSGEGSLDVEDAQVVDSNELHIPVNGTFEYGDTAAINADSDDSIFTAAPDAEPTSNLTLMYDPETAVDTVEVESDYQITVDNPNFEIISGEEDDPKTVVAGVDNQNILGDAAIYNDDNSISALVETTDDGQIHDGQNVTIVSNSTDITFADENEDLSVAYVNSDDLEDGAVTNTDVGFDIHVDENILTFEVDTEALGLGSDESLGTSEALAVHDTDGDDGLSFNVSSDVEEGEVAGFELQTGGEGDVVSEPENDNTLEADRIELDLDFPPTDEDDIEDVLLDDAGADGFPFGIELEIPDADDEDVAVINQGTNVTVSLEETGEAFFDERAQFNGEHNAFDSDHITVTANTIEYEAQDSILANGDTISLADIQESGLNVTADVTEADLDVVTNSTTQETTTSDTIGTQELDIDAIGGYVAEPNLDDTAVSEFDEVNTDVASGETETANVVVANESYAIETEDGFNQDLAFWPYGGTTVDLELAEAPDDAADVDTLLNTTQLTTDALDAQEDGLWGDAAFNFTGDTIAGDYVVNATVDDETLTQMTFTVQAGEPVAFDVEGEDNAFRGGGIDDMDSISTDNEHRAATYNVSVFDEYGALVDDPDQFNFVLDGDHSLIGIADSINEDGVPGTGTEDADMGAVVNSGDIDLSDGYFYAFTSSTSASTFELSAEGAVDDDIGSDSGEATFYRSASDAQLDFEMELDVGDEVTIEAQTISEDDNLIEVPRIDASLSTDNDSVATLEDGVTTVDELETDRSGLISANLTAQGVGEADITADFDDNNHDRGDASTTETLQVVDEAAELDIVEFGDVNINEGELANVSVDIENSGDADAEGVDVELDIDDGEIIVTDTVDIDVDDTTTVTFDDVETDELAVGDYDMEANADHEDDTASDTATLTVEETFVELDVTLDDVEIFEGNNTDIDVEIENTGDADAEDIDVELDIDDGEISLDDTVDVDAGDSTTVTFEDVETEDFETGDYDMEATATHDDDEASDTATLTVEEVEEEDDGIPGFTAGIAALALLGAALLALRLRDQE